MEASLDIFGEPFFPVRAMELLQSSVGFSVGDTCSDIRHPGSRYEGLPLGAEELAPMVMSQSEYSYP